MTKIKYTTYKQIPTLNSNTINSLVLKYINYQEDLIITV